MDQKTFTNLTGVILTDSQVARFGSLVEACGQKLEDLLGWPLDPSDWGNQYLEIGKTKCEWWTCPSVDTPDLDDPDPVVGRTRLYTWRPSDPYLFVDPALKIHKVKLVKNGITYRTFEVNDYSLRLMNGRSTYGRYIEFADCLYRWLDLWYYNPDILALVVASRAPDGDYLQVAIDADWAFPEDDENNLTLPLPLQMAWADFIAYRIDLKRDVKSESVLSHSYTRNVTPDPEMVHADEIRKYAGPKGTMADAGVIL